jgi:hypothetical protein
MTREAAFGSTLFQNGIKSPYHCVARRIPRRTRNRRNKRRRMRRKRKKKMKRKNNNKKRRERTNRNPVRWIPDRE